MKAEDVVFLERQGTLVARIRVEVDHHTVEQLRDRIDARVFYFRPDTLVLDFEAVGFMDSSGLALIIGRAEVAAELGAVVRIVGMSKSLIKLVRLAGLERIKNLTIAMGDY